MEVPLNLGRNMKRYLLTASLLSMAIISCGKETAKEEDAEGLGVLDERFKGIIESLPIVEFFDDYKI